MKREHWVGLFQKLPEAMHDQVVFSLSTGIDVFNQRFLLYADEFLVLRGRLGGTDESERVFMVPWDELKMIFFSRPVEDEMLFKTFGEIIGGVRKSLGAKSKAEEEQEEDDRLDEDDEDHRPEPVRLPAASVQALAEASAPKAGANMSELRSRLLQARKPAPNVQTNKPGPGTKPAGK